MRDIFTRRSEERDIHQRKIANAKKYTKLNAIFGALTVAGALWVNVNMDDGEAVDLHKHVPEIVERSMEQNPTLDRDMVQQQGVELADAWEKNIRLVTVIFPLLNGVQLAFWYSRRKKLEAEAEENPHLKAVDNNKMDLKP